MHNTFCLKSIAKLRLYALIFAAILIAGMQQNGFAGDKTTVDAAQTNQLCVALVFSDGPSSMLTPQILQTLSAKNVKATFFPSGALAQSYPGLVRQESVAGHEIGTRAWMPPMTGKLTDDQYRADLTRADQALKMATGKSPKLFAPFDVDFAPEQCEWVNKEFGYQTVYWDVDASMLVSQGPTGLASGIVSRVKPGSIIMMSDMHGVTAQALPLVIDALAAKGYKFVTVSEMAALAPQPVAQQKPLPQSKSLAANHPARSASKTSPFGSLTPP